MTPHPEVALVILLMAVVGLLLLISAVLLLARRTNRRRTGLRWTGYVLVVLALCLIAPFIALLATAWNDYRQEQDLKGQIYHLTAPQVFDGVTFPAGSTVHLNKTGVPEDGDLSGPTRIGGLVLVGNFRLFTDDQTTGPLAVAEGTLASPAVLHGIPCGPGDLKLDEGETSCVLAREWLFAGHALAAGQPVKVSQLFQDERPSFQLGTLARSELWYDVLWPPGTAVSGVTERPERNGHGSGPNGDGTAFCLLGGSTVVLPGALLHGPLTYAVNGDERTVKPGCSDPFDTQSGDQGYAEVGSDRYSWGTRPNGHWAWRWRNQP